MNKPESIRVEVVLAMPERQELVAMDISAGTTIGDAIEQSGVLDRFDGFKLDPEKVGVFGRKAPIGQVLHDGDRVEIYRSLIADPKEVRRQRARKQAKTRPPGTGGSTV